MRVFWILIIACQILLAGCNTINPVVSAGLNSAGQDYMGAKANIQQADDMKLRVWLDSACAVNIGALQRAISTSGNPSIANAIFTACPVPAVGVTSTSATGSMQVQTFNLPPIVRGPTLNGSEPNPAPQQGLGLANPVSTPAVTTTLTPSAPLFPAKKAAKKPAPVTIPQVQPVPQPIPQPITATPLVATPSSLSLPSALPGQ